MKEPRLSLSGLKVLCLMLNTQTRLCGADIARSTDILTGTLYPLLARLEGAGWLTSAWEDIDPHVEARPRRRFYAVTEMGRVKATAALSQVKLSEPAPAVESNY